VKLKSIEEVKANVFAIFPGADEVEVTSRKHQGKSALAIKVAAMYESPQYKGEGGLVGMVKALQDATGATGIEIEDEFARGGCETCDYGSSYGKTYIVWEEAA
jgi:hypothetical protein